MSYRKTKTATQSKKSWKQFIANNNELILKTGLPEIVLQTEEHWDDFLMHGYLDHHNDPFHFNIDKLDKSEYQSLKELVAKYFEAGYLYYTPIALSAADQQQLAARFDKVSG